MTTAQLIVKSLEAFGVDTVFGLPGAHSASVYDALYDSPIRHVLVRHEQAAGFMADGYARATGRPGVCLTTAGPGATNAATAIAAAHADSIPVLHLSAQIQSQHIGRDCGAYHELDLVSAFGPMTKWAAEARRPDDVASLMAEAFRQLTTGRPRPVFLSFPNDVLKEETACATPEPGPSEPARPDAKDIDSAERAIAESTRPMLLAGGGAITAGATEQLVHLAELLSAPVAATTMGRGAMPEDHRLALGWVRGNAGMEALKQADLLAAIGCRFDEITTANWTLEFPPIVHIDIDPSVIGKSVEPAVGVVADARLALEAIGEAMAGPRREPWFTPSEGETSHRPGIDGEIVPVLRRVLERDAIVAADVGQSVWHLFHSFPVLEPRTFLHSATYIAMGHAFPAALGAKAAFPNRDVVGITGDGAFMMVCGELATAVQERLPVPVIVANDRGLGAIRRIQERQYGGRTIGVDLHNPEFEPFARSFGAGYARVDRADAFEPALRGALAGDMPTLIELVK